MSRTLALAVLASAPTLAAADATTDYIHKLETIVQSLQTRVDALEKRDATRPGEWGAPKPPASQGDDAPAQLTQGEVDKLRQRLANQQMKVDNLYDDAQSGPLAGLSIKGYIDPSYVYNRNRRTSSFLFLDGSDPYTYDRSSIGDVFLEIKKTFGSGTYAPSVDLQIMPNRGYGSYTLNSVGDYTRNLFASALATIPITDRWSFFAGYTPSFAGYEYLQATQMLTMSHGLLYDWSEPGTYMGAGGTYYDGKDSYYKLFIGNEEYRASQSILAAEGGSSTSNRYPTITGRIDYGKSSTLWLGGSFSLGRNTLYAPTDGCGAGQYGYQCTSGSPYGNKVYVEGDLTYTGADVVYNAQLDYGQLQHGAWNGGTAQWWGLSALAHRKWTTETLGRMGATLRFDYLNDQKNGGGGGGLYIPSATDGLNGFGIAPDCLANSTVNGTDCKGANRYSLTGTLLFLPTAQITIKAELRHDWASQAVFSREDGSYNKSNDIFGLQFIYAY